MVHGYLDMHKKVLCRPRAHNQEKYRWEEHSLNNFKLQDLQFKTKKHSQRFIVTYKCYIKLFVIFILLITQSITIKTILTHNIHQKSISSKIKDIFYIEIVLYIKIVFNWSSLG